MTGTCRRAVLGRTLRDGGVSGPGGRCLSPGRAPDAVGMMDSVAPPVVRHRQQALDLVTGVRQGLQKVHETMLMRTNLEKIIVEVRVPPAVTPLGVYRRPWASWGGGSVPFGDLEAGRRLSASGTF